MIAKRVARVLLASTVLLFAFAGCKNDEAAPAPAPTAPDAPGAPLAAPPTAPAEPADSPMVKEVTALADKVCACTDQACAQALGQETDATLAKYATASGGRAEIDALGVAANRINTCVRELMAKAPTKPTKPAEPGNPTKPEPTKPTKPTTGKNDPLAPGEPTGLGMSGQGVGGS